MNFKNYSQINYENLIKELKKATTDKDLHELTIATQVGVKSVGTIRNCYNLDVQIVSDEVLSKVFKVLNMNVFIAWIDGDRKYFIKK